MISYLVLSVLGVLLVAADQITKALVAAHIQYPYGHVPVIGNFFDLVHWHNTGGAWGAFSGATWLLTVFSVLCALVLLYFYASAKPVFLRLSLILIVAGATGNLIDRIRVGYVVDFLSFYNLFGYSFPAFNVADICITAGCIGMLIYVLFLSRKAAPFRQGTLAERIFSEKREGAGGKKRREGSENREETAKTAEEKKAE